MSYKGGTGRSVASANLAYHLSALGRSVALVDLDLGASTMHHICRLLDDSPEMSILESRKLDERLDAVRHRLLARWLEGDHSNITHPREIRAENLYSRDNIIADGRKGKILASKNRSAGLSLYANHGNDAVLSNVEVGDLRDRLHKFLDYCTSRYQYVICDLRSGDSKLLQALCHPKITYFDPIWLLFFRHTPQHLSAVRLLVEHLANYNGQPLSSSAPALDMRLVPTASLSLEGDEVISDTAKNLAGHVRSRADAQIRALKDSYKVKTVGVSLPYENALLFAEGIIGTSNLKYDYHSEIKRLAVELDEESR